MKDHLSNRFQRVTVKDTLSNRHSISNDVTHGSILGPILFNIFMNDLSYVIITSLVNLSNQIQLRERANRSRKKKFFHWVENIIKQLIRQLCVHRDMKPLVSLKSTQEARVALGYGYFTNSSNLHGENRSCH